MKHPFFDTSTPTQMTPERAVRYGKLLINLPIVFILALGPLIGALFGRIDIGLIGFVLGFILGWLWWSFSVPRWRNWAKRNGADEQETQRLAESGRGPLVWPKGHFFEKTEFRIRKKPER
jgi:hypothetical protein